MIVNPLILRIISESIQEIEDSTIVNRFIIYQAFMLQWFKK